MYNHSKQYRCTIIRGKTQKEIDNFLPVYAQVLDQICPCLEDDFEKLFNEHFSSFLSERDRVKKTFDNHRTEIAGKLFGMYFRNDDGNVYVSERTRKFLEDNDQPAFFKDICYKAQFPNGSQKIATTVKTRVKDNISIRPYAFLLKCLQYAKNAGIILTQDEIGYYVLNSLDVLQGNANPLEVIEQIQIARKEGMVRKVHTEGKASSYDTQHIREQLNYLELANLIFSNREGEIWLNSNENEVIELFACDWDKAPEFDVYAFDLDTLEGRKKLQLEWDKYYSKLSVHTDMFETTLQSLNVISKNEKEECPASSKGNRMELGDIGENYVYEYEKNRVKEFNPRLIGRVLSLGKTKGLGYDIQSVVAEKGDMAEFVKYIEVKSTKRVTAPDIEDGSWRDTINITRNEWIAAKQFKELYSIYRVYMVRGGVVMYIIQNPYGKKENGTIEVVPLTYRLDFQNNAIDRVVSEVRANV